MGFQSELSIRRIYEDAADFREALTQIVELVEAAGVEVGGRGIAQALQIMLLDFMTEYGADPAQIQQALSTVDTDAIGKLIDQQRGAQ